MKTMKGFGFLVAVLATMATVGYPATGRAEVGADAEACDETGGAATDDDCEHRCAMINMQCLNRCMAMPFYSQNCFIACEKTRDACYSGC